jgi:beta-lactamase class A
MISYSDNYATEILSMQVSQVVLKQVFTDIGLQAPQLDANYVNYTISAANFSKFISVIYNAGYLSSAQSSFAAELLATSDFKSGLIQGLPEGTRIIHKFGEAGQEGAHELHESGIIYLNSRAYLLTVMTRGKDIKQLPATLSAISGIAYKYFKKDDV